MAAALSQQVPLDAPVPGTPECSQNRATRAKRAEGWTCCVADTHEFSVDQALTFSLEGKADVVIENVATLADRPGRAPGIRVVELYPDRQDVASALPLFGTSVNSGVVFNTGTLRLVLDHFQLTVKADPDYEAWNVTGPGGPRIVCMPGGQLAVWT